MGYLKAPKQNNPSTKDDWWLKWTVGRHWDIFGAIRFQPATLIISFSAWSRSEAVWLEAPVTFSYSLFLFLTSFHEKGCFSQSFEPAVFIVFCDVFVQFSFCTFWLLTVIKDWLYQDFCFYCLDSFDSFRLCQDKPDIYQRQLCQMLMRVWKSRPLLDDTLVYWETTETVW